MTNETGECLIPSEIGGMLQENLIRVKVLLADSRWFGMTYAQDLLFAREAFTRMQEQGIYTHPLH